MRVSYTQSQQYGSVLLGTCFFLSLGVRLYRIGERTLWLDEALTIKRIHLGLSPLILDSLKNGHSPIYFLILHLIAATFSSKVALRLPSAIFGAISSCLALSTASRIGGLYCGIVTGLLVAFSPQQIESSQEARPYAFLTLLVTLAIYGAILIAAGRPASGPRAHREHKIGWLCYGAGTCLAAATSLIALPWVVVSNIVMMQTYRKAADNQGSFRIRWASVSVQATGVSLLLASFIAHLSKRGVFHRFDWIPKLSVRNAFAIIDSVFLFRASYLTSLDLAPTSVPGLGAIVAGLGILGYVRSRKSQMSTFLLISATIGPAALALFSLFKPIFISRYLIWNAIPFFVLAGLGATVIPMRLRLVALTFLVFQLGLNLETLNREELYPRWDLAGVLLGDKLGSHDIVLTSDPNGPTLISSILWSGKVGDDKGGVFATSDVDDAIRKWRQGYRVWAIFGRTGLGRPESLQRFRAELSVMGEPTVKASLGKEIVMFLFPQRNAGI